MPYNMPYKRGDGKDLSTDLLRYKANGVRAIEQQLMMLGLLNQSKINGVFGWATRRAVKKFQAEEGLGADGVVGPATLKALFWFLIDETERELRLPKYLLHAIISKESSSDPGAYYFNVDLDTGAVKSRDLGIAMLNSSAYADRTEEERMDPLVAVPLAGERLKLAWGTYRGKGKQLRLDCTIASYNNPTGARDLFNNKPITAKLRDYIADVRALIAEEGVE